MKTQNLRPENEDPKVKTPWFSLLLPFSSSFSNLQPPAYKLYIYNSTVYAMAFTIC